MADLYLQGELQADIAIEVGLSEATVSRDLKVLHKQWLADSRADFSKAKARELAAIFRLEREHWAAWLRSCEDAETCQTTTGKDGVERITTTTKGQAGDPRFLAGIEKCVAARRKLLGLDTPELIDAKLEHRIPEIEAMIERIYGDADDAPGDAPDDGPDDGPDDPEPATPAPDPPKHPHKSPASVRLRRLLPAVDPPGHKKRKT